MYYLKTTLLSLLFIINFSCLNDSKTKVTKDGYFVENKSLSSSQNETFTTFLKKFVADSVFRSSRIHFPIKGYNSDFTPRDNYDWYSEEWELYFSEDVQNRNNYKERIIEEDQKTIWRLYKENSGYDVNYHFKLNDGKWYLTYYYYKNF